MEIIDIYNGNREKTGRTIIRDNIEKLKQVTSKHVFFKET